MTVGHAAPGLGREEAGLSSGMYFHYRRHARSFETLAVDFQTPRNLSVPDMVTERVTVTMAGPELFEMLGAVPALGRLFTMDDGAPGFMDTTWAVPVLLSNDLWQRRFGADPSIVGQTITLSDRPRRVVGVMPADFVFPDAETQLWMLNMPVERTASFAREFDYGAVARLWPGVSPVAAQAELARILPSIEGTYPDATAERLAEVRLTPVATPLKAALVGSVRTLLLVVFGGMLLLLMVACANIANLFLLRADERDPKWPFALRWARGRRTCCGSFWAKRPSCPRSGQRPASCWLMRRCGRSCRRRPFDCRECGRWVSMVP